MSNPAHTYALDAESDFIAECMSEMADEHPEMEQDQKLAVCYSKFRKGERHMSILALAGDPPKQMGDVTEDGGVKRARFVKDALRVGNYEHPVKGWKLGVDEPRLAKFVQTFRKMKGNGVAIEVVTDHGQGAEAVKGYIEDMFFLSGTLYVVPEMRGDGIELAKTVKTVSVLIDPDFKDGKGTGYGEAITHVSLSQQPIVPGQSDFIPLSRSGHEVKARVYAFAATASSVKETKMAFLDEVRKRLSLDEKATEDDVLKALDEKKKLAEGDDDEGDDPMAACMADPDMKEKHPDEAERSKACKVKLGLSATAMSRVDVDPDTLEELAQSTGDRIKSLIEKGKLTPAAAKLVNDKLVGPVGARKPMFLSLKGNPGASTSIMRTVLDILETNDPIELAEKTGRQVVAMSRHIPDGQSTEADADVLKMAEKSNPSK